MSAFDAADFLEDGSARTVAKKIQTLGAEHLDAVERQECARKGDPRATVLRAIEKRRGEIDSAGPEGSQDGRSDQDKAIDDILNEAAAAKASELNEAVAPQSPESPSFLDGCVEALSKFGSNGSTVEDLVEQLGGDDEGVHVDQVYEALLNDARCNTPRVAKVAARHFYVIS
jgi:hypothetical protein